MKKYIICALLSIIEYSYCLGCDNSSISWDIEPNLMVYDADDNDRILYSNGTLIIKTTAAKLYEDAGEYGCGLVGCCDQTIRKDNISYTITANGVDLYTEEIPREISGLRYRSLEMPAKTRDITIANLIAKTGCVFVNNKATITISFTAVGYQKTNKNETERWTKTISKSVLITVYDCNAGTLKIDESKAPNIGTGEIPIYAIYNDKNSQGWSYYEIPVHQNKPASIFSTAGDQYLYTYVVENEGRTDNSSYYKKETTAWDSDYEYNWLMPMSGLLVNGLLNDGDIRHIRRVNSYKTSYGNTIQCISPDITLKAVEPLKLKNLRDDELQKSDIMRVCSSPQSYNNYCGEDGSFTIEGNSVYLNTDNQIDYEIEYGWEYKTVGSSDWKKITEDNLNTNKEDPRLCLPNSFIKGKTYFRQVVITKKFNREVRAESSGKSDDWRSYVVYDLFTSISADNFDISETEKICQGESFDDKSGFVKVNFTPSAYKVYASKTDSEKENDFSFEWKRNNKTITGITGDSFHCDEIMKESVTYSVDILDGCGTKVTLTSLKEVKERPELDALAFDVQDANVTTQEGNLIEFEVTKNKPVILSVSEEGKSGFEYYLVTPNSTLEESPIEQKLSTQWGNPLNADKINEIIADITTYGDYSVYLIKKMKGCSSEPVYFRIRQIDDIYNNIIDVVDKTTVDGIPSVYVCKGSDIDPYSFSGSDPKGGYTDGEYTYVWESTPNPETVAWSQISGTKLLNKDLVASIQAIDAPLYVRRTVYSKSGNGSIQNASSFIRILPYEEPSFKIGIASSQIGEKSSPLTFKVCYDQSAYFNYTINNASFNDQYKMGTTNITYILNNPEDATISERLSGESSKFTSNKILTAEMSFCGKVFSSSNKIAVNVNENLAISSKDLSFSPCMLEGSSFDVSVKIPGDYIYSFTDYKGITLSMKMISASVPIPEDNNNNDVVFHVMKTNGMCSQKSTITVPSSKIMKPLEKTNLIVSGCAKDLTKGYLICNGEPITITPAAGSPEDNRLHYAWIVDDRETDYTDRNLPNVTFSDYGTSHVIRRISSHWEGSVLCDEIEDEVTVFTREKYSSSSSPVAEKSVICYNDNATVSMNASSITGGSSDFSFAWSKSSEQDGTYVSCANGDASSFTENSMTQTAWYKLTISDNECKGGNYIKEFYPAKVTVMPNLEFSPRDISISPSAISMADFEDGSASTFVTIEDTKKWDEKDETWKWGFYLNDKLVESKTTQKQQYAISKVMASDNSEVGYCVTRNITISSDKICSAKICGAIPVEQGFTSDFTITSELGKHITVCPEKKVTVEIENLPDYNNLSLALGDVTLQWKRRAENLSSWTSINGAKEKSLSVSPDANGTTYIYACQLSYVHEGNTINKMSDEITVDGYNKMDPGIVSILNGEYVVNEDNTYNFTLEMNDSWGDGWTKFGGGIGCYLLIDGDIDNKYYVPEGERNNTVEITLDNNPDLLTVHKIYLNVISADYINEISFILRDSEGNVVFEKKKGECSTYSSAAGGTPVELFSFNPAIIYDSNSRTSSVSVCKGSGVNLQMEYTGSSNGTFQWQCSENGVDWNDLTANLNVRNVNTSKLSYKNDNVNKSIQFRCLAIDMCKDVVISSNVTSVYVNKNLTIASNDIMMLSSKVVPRSSQHVDAISLSIPTDNANDYYYYYSAGNTKGGGNLINFKYNTDQTLPKDNEGEIGNFYAAGTHTINVYKTSKETGCISDTIPYSYTLYDSLGITKIVNSAASDTLCRGDKMTNIITLYKIYGGNPNSEYAVTWYYKTGGMEYFSVLSEEIETGFGFRLSVLDIGNEKEYSIREIDGLNSTTSFYCKVSSPGYPGNAAISNTTTIYVHDRLEAGEIDKDQTNLCYGQSSSIKSLAPATGGSGKYSYYYISSVDNGETWETETQPDRSESLFDTGELRGSKIYKRVVIDNVCGNRDTTTYSKFFYVQKPILISGNDIIASPVVANGSPATIVGQDINYSYVLIDGYDGYSVIDTIVGTAAFKTAALLKRTDYIVKKINDWGCTSVNDTTIHIEVEEPLGGGKIMFENNSDWVCSGASSVGRIINYIEPSGLDLSYKWFYCNSIVDDVCNSSIMGKTTNKQVTTKTIDLDTCGIKFDNNTGVDLIYHIYRLTYGTDGTGRETVVSSDTLQLHVVPTLKSVNNKLIDSLSGSLAVTETNFCIGDRGGVINHSISAGVRNAWRNNSFGSLMFGGSLNTYWESADGIVSTASNSTAFEKIEGTEMNFTDENHYLSSYTIEKMRKSQTVRFVIDDGCSVLTTPNSDGRQWVSSLESLDDSKFVITPEGIEEGDDVSIKRVMSVDKSSWFSDEECHDTLAYNNAYLDLANVTFDTKVYYQSFDENGCKDIPYEIPLTIYRKSKGGKILNDQRACLGGDYNGINSAEAASGCTGVFSYQWQCSTNPSLAKSWKDIDNATDISISADKVNGAVSNFDEMWFRRVAMTEFGKKVYSDTVHLNHYSELKPGSLSFEGGSTKNKFCQYDTIPNIVSTPPTGGMSGDEGFVYSTAWELSVNGGEYKTMIELTPASGLAINPFIFISTTDYDRKVTNTFSVKAKYADFRCGEVYGEPFSFTIYAESTAPSIYQDKDSCNAKSVTVLVEDSVNYKYKWFVLDENGNETWQDYNVFSKKIDRVNEFEVSEYGVQATSVSTGCLSDVTYFNLDSLPVLIQPTLNSLPTVCYGYDVTIPLGAASGGSGEKSYQWQFSYDGVSFTDQPSASLLNLSVKEIKFNTWFRRVAKDMCQTDTSNAILVQVYGKVPAPKVEILDRMCPGQGFIINVDNEDEMTMYEDSLSALGFNYSISIYDKYNPDSMSNHHATLTPAHGSSMFGFEENSKRYYAVSSFDWSKQHIINENKCYSREVLTFDAYNTDKIAKGNNIIACDVATPCNGSSVHIIGDSGVGSEGNASNFKYSWFVSKDNISWNKIMLVSDKNLDVAIYDTMFVKRSTTNGCDTLDSNILTFIGQKLDDVDYANTLGLSVITTLGQDSSSSVNLKTSSYEIGTSYLTSGDGILPSLVYGSNILPYSAEVYKDSLLSIVRTEGCASAYKINPLRDGRIHMDGDGKVCAGSDIPSIVATEIEGGKDSVSYQWQYKNEYVNEYVNLVGATNDAYTPLPVAVKTWYRRIATSGEYMSISNEISVEIVSVPEIGLIRPSVSKEYLEENGLLSNDFMAEKTVTLTMGLLDSVKNATDIEWSYNTENPDIADAWEKCKYVPIDLTKEEQSLDITDITAIVYYRVDASNVCGSASSQVFKVVTKSTPDILGNEVIIKPALCLHNEAFIRCVDSKNGDASQDYVYTYTGFEDKAVTKVSGIEEVYLGGETTSGIYFKDVTDTIGVVVTRKSVSTGAISTKSVIIPFTAFKADFNFTVNEQVHSSEEKVTITQGARVRFNNLTENAKKFYWELIKPLNTQYSTVTPYGLYSTLENPACYFYNAGEYSVTFIATNSNGCSDTIISNVLDLPKDELRSLYVKDAAFVEEGVSEENYIFAPIAVYPAVFSKSLFISYADSDYEFSIMDEKGSIIKTGHGFGITEVHTDGFAPGAFVIQVNNQFFKLIKH